jgi:hypothetical protein
MHTWISQAHGRSDVDVDWSENQSFAKRARIPELVPQDCHRRFLVIGLRFAGIVILLAGLAVGHVEGADKRFRLCAEILSAALEDPKEEAFVGTLERAVPEYGIGEVMIHGFRVEQWIGPAVKEDRVAAYRQQLQRLKRLGVRITLSGPGPSVPDGFFDQDPEARWFGAGRFQEYIRESTTELLRRLPEADGLEIYLWETALLNDVDFFKGMGWLPRQRAFAAAERWMSPAGMIAELLTAYARGAEAAGKDFTFLTFAHFPAQERLVIDALKLVDPKVPMLLDHKNQPGDWSPYRPANNVMLEVTGRKAMLLFDGTGEYWGQSRTPYCYPEEIRARVQHALRANPSIESFGMRVHWAQGNHVFGSFNEVNWYALSRLAEDPETPVEELWRGWAERRFGKRAASAVTRALERTNQIGNLTYYVHGAWVHNHSEISNLAYLESHEVQYAQSAMDWNPGDFRTVARLRELVDAPSERTVEWVLGDRKEALRLNGLSLEDVERVKADLPPAEYEKLRRQLTLQRHFVEASLPHMEAFLRYRMAKKGAGADNRQRLAAALRAVEEKAREVEQVYGESEPFLTAAALRRYAAEIRKAVAQ